MSIFYVSKFAVANSVFCVIFLSLTYTRHFLRVEFKFLVTLSFSVALIGLQSLRIKNFNIKHKQQVFVFVVIKTPRRVVVLFYSIIFVAVVVFWEHLLQHLHKNGACTRGKTTKQQKLYL